MESSEYKTSNPFAPWLTQDEVNHVASEIHEAFRHTRYFAIALIFIDGRLETTKTTVSKKPPRNGE